MKPFIRAFKLLNRAERHQVYLLLPGIILMALLETVTIASISPFLSMVTDPNSIETNTLLKGLYSALGFTSSQSFLIFVGITALSLLVISNSFSMLMVWLLLRFSWLRDYSLSHRLLSTYLQKPYIFFTERNSADLQKTMLSEVQQAIQGMLIPGMRMLANAVVAVFIMALLIIVNPLLAASIAVVLGLAYLGIYGSVQRRLKRLGEERVIANRGRFQSASEAIEGVKEIKLLGKEAHFLNEYAGASRHYSLHMATSDTLSTIPRYALDMIAIGGLLAIILFMLVGGRDVSTVIPLVGLYAFAGYRLLPALMQIYYAITKARFNSAAVDAVAKDLEAQYCEPETSVAVAPLAFQEALELRGIMFSYPDAKEPALDNLSLTIKANTSVAFVGSTGSGKTTLVDIVLGLLTPQSGQIVIDGEPLEQASMPAWQRNLGYVPQHIYLSDNTIAQNIAFGVAAEELEMAAVERAAKIANLHDFIVQDLSAGYDTVVGERGIRLSGGQRQRIGIARALYHDPDILILDEATSALDNVTEESVFGAIRNVAKSKTAIMIAHRISTVRDCDQIFVIEKGRIVSQGTYDALLDSSDRFRALAQAGT